MIQPYWKRVHAVTSEKTSLPLEFTPAQYLLHLSKISHKKYYKSVAMLTGPLEIQITPFYEGVDTPN